MRVRWGWGKISPAPSLVSPPPRSFSFSPLEVSSLFSPPCLSRALCATGGRGAGTTAAAASPVFFSFSQGAISSFFYSILSPPFSFFPVLVAPSDLDPTSRACVGATPGVKRLALFSRARRARLALLAASTSSRCPPPPSATRSRAQTLFSPSFHITLHLSLSISLYNQTRRPVHEPSRSTSARRERQRDPPPPLGR